MNTMGDGVLVTLIIASFSFLAGASVQAHLHRDPDRSLAPKPEEAPADAPAEAPLGPPCIHESCARELVALECSNVVHHSTTESCNAFAVRYDRVCVCDRWATADGGLW